MKRRGFLGILGGAAVAGPAAAKSVVAQAAPLSSAGNLMGSLTAHSYSTQGVVATSGGMFSSLDRIAKLKRLISGEEEPEFDLYDTHSERRICIENAVQSLHSVSPVRKIAILRREAKRMEIERQKKHWANELKQLLGMEP